METVRQWIDTGMSVAKQQKRNTKISRMEVRTMVTAKPNMSNLRGKEGREIFETIKHTKPANLEQVRVEAEACKKRLLDRRSHEK